MKLMDAENEGFSSDQRNGPVFHIVGDAYVDFFCFLDGGWPENGGDSRLDQPVKTYAGGSATNTATHLQALQIHFSNRSQAPQVCLHSVLNREDHYGQLLLAHAAKHQFPIVNYRKKGKQLSTGHCIAIVSGGERSFMTHQGCVGEFKAEDINIDRVLSAERLETHFHIAGFYNMPGFWHHQLEAKLEALRDSRPNVTISLVTQHDATKKWDGGFVTILKFLNFAIMNDVEARNIVRQGLGKDYTDVDGNDAENQCWADYFAISPDTWVIVTRGEQGAVALKGGKVILNQATVAVKPVDPTGAGDSFTAGFLHGIWTWKNDSTADVEDQYDQQWPIDAIAQGLKWGCAVGRAAVLIRGASIPPCTDQIEKFLRAL